MDSMAKQTRVLRRRDNLPPWTIATFTILSAIFVILLIGLVWRKLRLNKAADKQSHATPNTTSEISHKHSDWLRNNSNVIWSTYIEEDGLKSQFALSNSRLFSIASVSTIEDGEFPFDTEPSSKLVTTQDPNKRSEPPKLELHLTNDENTLRSRAAHDQDLTPTPNSPMSRDVIASPSIASPASLLTQGLTSKVFQCQKPYIRVEI
ncbi:uncharacterized protein A1O9_06124 [Exophiala aquamarina CBS 119918]|uniref:Uncharacterized protein n=1 Tax=Exophiala aquamarina CBS 119918 TaxID=1182545 RepID=A0A072PFZ7_9EURO|nr:uncharacterized protein A1O9_06124 [Exophiala aquamarina CBS 119918]KEF58198.1 hypothetical protein A1O9_06124 [Exophiala aquamarina CBS 119918]